MFPRKYSVLLTMIILLMLGTASVATAGRSIFVGVDFPTGEFAKPAKTGWAAGGYYTFDLLPIVDIGGLVAYNNLSTDAGHFTGTTNPYGGSIDAWEVHALGQLKIAIFKGFLGLGLANYEGEDAQGARERKTDLSWQLGVAANFLMLEGRLGYHQIPAKNDSINWVQLSVGVTF